MDQLIAVGSASLEPVGQQPADERGAAGATRDEIVDWMVQNEHVERLDPLRPRDDEDE